MLHAMVKKWRTTHSRILYKWPGRLPVPLNTNEPLCVCPVPIIDCIYIKSTLQTTCSERKMAVREQTAVQMYVCAIYWPNRTRGSEKKKVMYRGKKEPRGNMDDHILEKKWRIRSQVAVVANPVGVGLFKSPGLLGHKLNEIWRENISWFRLCTKTLIWVGGWSWQHSKSEFCTCPLQG